MEKPENFSVRHKNIVSGSHYINWKPFRSFAELCSLSFVESFEEWIDEYGNLVLLTPEGMKVKKTKKPNQKSTLDFLFKADFESILKFTEYVFFRKYNPNTFCFVGKDGLLRVYKDKNRVPPLSVSLFILKDLSVMMENKGKEVSKKIKKIYQKNVFQKIENIETLKQMGLKYNW